MENKTNNDNELQNDKNIKTGCAIVVIIFIIIIYFFSVSSSDSSKQRENDAFEKQLNKNPSAWTEEENQRYNNYVDWLNKQ